MRRFAKIAALGFAVLAGCESKSMDEESVSCPSSTATKKVVELLGSPSFAFSPKDLTINRGDTVVWCSLGDAVHTTTSGADCTADGLWDSGSMGQNSTFMIVFDSTGVDVVGTIPYFSSPQCQCCAMDGTITVNP